MLESNSMGALVEIFRALKNPSKFGLVIGVVIEPLPNVKIDIGNGIILEKDDLLFTASMLKDYEREYKIESTDAQLKGQKLDSNGAKFDLSGTTWSASAIPAVINDTTPSAPRPVPMIPEGVASSFSFTGTTFDAKATSFDMDSNDFKSTGKLTLTTEIEKDDLVAIIASESNQLFLVVDKVLSF